MPQEAHVRVATGCKFLVLVQDNKDTTTPTVTVLERDDTPPRAALPRSPTNTHTYRVSAFIDTLKPARGVRFNLAWSYGDYLTDVPVRLGRNVALDAAADALVTACDRFSAPRADHSHRFLAKYVEAVRTLRLCLDDQATATTSETLCAVMLLLICQIFVPGTRDSRTSHSEGAAQIYRYRGQLQARDEFERKLIRTLRGPVLFEALFNPNISLTEQEWDALVGCNLADSSLEGKMILCLARGASLMRRGGFVLDPQRWNHDRPFCPHLEYEARVVRSDYLPVLTSLRDRFYAIDETALRQSSNSELVADLQHCHSLRTYGLALFVGIVLNYIVCVAAGNILEIVQESQRYAEEIILLARVGARYRPVGASLFGICLAAASVVSSNAETKAIAKELEIEYDRELSEVYVYN
ncbi:hypothetical protein PMZ80_008344 [Knufia obscura]|uniref:Uncharacterized protein n=1 Tax=Knufia obscura TaxID=1635080 RepID=A0ABR0REJ1_9EURO|nr:hypothetical protein PMZ80_008344 [Knufia obscura]